MKSKGTMYFAGGCLIAAGLVLGGLGLLAVIAHRYVWGLPCLVIGVVLVVWAIRKVGQVVADSPDRVDTRVSSLAAVSGGEITLGEVVGALRLSEADAQASLDRLVGEGICTREERGETAYYVFPGLAEVRMVKRCPYCGNEYPLRDPKTTCPSCGANLEATKAGG